MLRGSRLELDVISYQDLVPNASQEAQNSLQQALFHQGIVGIADIPDFEKKSRQFIDAARAFEALPPAVKAQYAPNVAAGEMEGYELGAEQFQNNQGQWVIDDKKASFYAHIPDNRKNKWPCELDLQTPYLALAELIFSVGKQVMAAIGLDHQTGLDHTKLAALARLLHYHKEDQQTNDNPDWCGAHFDHGVFTGLLPAYYFKDGIEIEEPSEAGLYIVPTHSGSFEKIPSSRKDILLFQVGEFGQLATQDRIQATRHKVCKTSDGVERYTLALFYSLSDEVTICSDSSLSHDMRYQHYQAPDGSISYGAWHQASIDRYRVIAR